MTIAITRTVYRYTTFEKTTTLYVRVPVTLKMCNFHKNQDGTFVKVWF